jgi:hypothetical protein
MSWSESFPIFTEEMVDEYEVSATPEEKAELEGLYDVEQVFNQQDKPHIVSISLFWKNVRDTDPDLPEPTRDRMQNARELGIAKRFDPWPHYVQPLLDGTPKLAGTHPDVVVRVHLARDLEFLIPDLLEAGCEVWWMKHPSIRFTPGGLWRLLPFGDKGKLVTMADTDRMFDIPADIGRTQAMAKAGLGVWRVPVPMGKMDDGGVHYRPLIASQIGLMGGYPVRQLLLAFTWHTLRGTVPNLIELPGCGPGPATWASWPNLYFDEWFMAVALYPRFAEAGMITFTPATSNSTLLMLDIEYVTWANPNSQLVFFPVESCCGPKISAEIDDKITAFPGENSTDKDHRVVLPS